MLLQELAHNVLHIFYPRLCEGCSKPLLRQERVLCIGCDLQLSRTCFHDDPENEAAMRFAGRVPFAHATAFAHFINEGLLQHLLHGLKYLGKTETGEYLGSQLATDLQEQTEWIKTVDIIVPVPLHKRKEAQRGYNQSLLIAEGMSKVLRIPIGDKILKRTRHTESQTQKSRSERISNMENAFMITGSSKVAGKHVLLVDDVLTTGATLEACAVVLLRQPGVRVSIAAAGLAS